MHPRPKGRGFTALTDKDICIKADHDAKIWLTLNLASGKRIDGVIEKEGGALIHASLGGIPLRGVLDLVEQPTPEKTRNLAVGW